MPYGQCAAGGVGILAGEENDGIVVLMTGDVASEVAVALSWSAGGGVRLVGTSLAAAKVPFTDVNRRDSVVMCT